MPTLYYVTDPMCSWCWGFRPVIERIEERLAPEVHLGYVLGGLAPDADEPMDRATMEYVQSAWRAVAERTGASFNFEFWERHHPRRSTWPACRAVLAAGERGREMFAAIQRAYYAEARDPSDPATLVAIAVELGFDGPTFATALDAPETRLALEAELELRDRLGVTGYPSLALEADGQRAVIARGWVDPAELLRALETAGLLTAEG